MVAFITNAEETALNNENAKQTQNFVQLSGIRNALNQRFFSVTKFPVRYPFFIPFLLKTY